MSSLNYLILKTHLFQYYVILLFVTFDTEVLLMATYYV